MLILPNLIYIHDAIPMKSPAGGFVSIGKLILKFMWKGKTAYLIKL